MQRTGTLEQFEQLVLAAVVAVPNGYAVSIHTQVEKFAGRSVKFGPVYSALNRMEGKGYVRSWRDPSIPQSAGRPKRYYKILPPGVSVLKDSLRTAARVLAQLKAAGFV